MIPEPPPELNGMEVAAWDSGYERGRREQWQPIATAPKDGTQVLVHDCGATMVSVYVTDPHGVGVGWYDNGIMNPPPTHWMPLPPVPASVPKEIVRFVADQITPLIGGK